MTPSPVLPETRPAPVETRPKTPQEVGELAARYIEEHGWVQPTPNGHDDGDANATCAWLALGAVNDGSAGDAGMALARNLGWDRASGFDGGCFVFAWNDAPERTLPEVLAALRSIR